MKLIIVESPSKCKTIENILGEDYICIATCGHIREIKDLSMINIKLMDQYSNYIDFNGCHWSMTIQLDIVKFTM